MVESSKSADMTCNRSEFVQLKLYNGCRLSIEHGGKRASGDGAVSLDFNTPFSLTKGGDHQKCLYTATGAPMHAQYTYCSAVWTNRQQRKT